MQNKSSENHCADRVGMEKRQKWLDKAGYSAAPFMYATNHSPISFVPYFLPPST